MNFYYFLTLLGAVTSCVAVYLYLIGNPNFLFINNLSYKGSATGFFINRTAFSCFLVLCLFSGIEYLRNLEIFKNDTINNLFKKIYIRIFILLITIGIITSFSRLGNFLFISLIIIYLIKSLFFDEKKNKLFLYSLLIIILFDVLIMGYYFGSDKLLARYSFLADDVSSYIETSLDNSLSRSNLSSFALSEFQNFIFFGYGAGAFEYLFNIRYENLSNYYTIHAHSDLAEFLGEFGLIGFCLIFISVVCVFFKNKILYFKNLLLLYFIFLILIFDFSLHVPIIQFTFVILLSINLKKKKLINK
ncbi:O-antigen ligase family protein [Candidatus Pelagibacter sp.]|nr:O-antigen ligase family protein [Candidatus Pelagibacter sp.]